MSLRKKNKHFNYFGAWIFVLANLIFGSNMSCLCQSCIFLLTQSGSSKVSTRGTVVAEQRISSNTLRKASSYNLNSGSILISLSFRTKCSTKPGCLQDAPDGYTTQRDWNVSSLPLNSPAKKCLLLLLGKWVLCSPSVTIRQTPAAERSSVQPKSWRKTEDLSFRTRAAQAIFCSLHNKFLAHQGANWGAHQRDHNVMICLIQYTHLCSV